MKQILTLLILTTILGGFGARSALAHAPESIHAGYDFPRQELMVSVQHIVTKPDEHFVQKIAVRKNGKDVDARTYTFQTSRRNQTTIPFKIPAVVGDTFQMQAICNKGGEVTETITVTEKAMPFGDQPQAR